MTLKMTSRWRLLLWFLVPVLVVCSIEVQAQLKGYTAEQLRYQLYYKVLDPAQTLSDSRWMRLEPNENSFGFTDKIYVFKLNIVNLGQQTLPVLLEVAYPLLDHLDIYEGNLAPSSQRYSLGDKQPFSDRVIKNRNFVIPADLEPNKTEIYFFKVQTTSATQFPLNIWNPVDFHEREKMLYGWYGLYFGTMLVMAMYNLFIYSSVRYSAYLWYVVYVLSMTLFQAAIEGLTFRYVWPQSLWWNSISTSFFVCTMMVGALLFQIYFLDLKNQSPNLYLLSKVAIAVSAILIISTFIVPYQYIIKVGAAVLTTSSCIIALFTGYWVWYKGYRQARYFCLAWTVLVIVGFGTVMNYVGLLPRSAFTEYSTQIGSLIEVVLLSFALAEYINYEKSMRYEAQQHAFSLQKIHNEELETKVAQRREELEVLNRKLSDLSTTDQSTGLRNRRFLNSYLREELERCQQYKRPMTLMMLDIDHFKQFNDAHGHLAGDACLQAVAKCISVSLRWPGDLVARFGGEEFCVLCETDSAGAVKVAERIRGNVERLEFRWQNQTMTVTISLGVVVKTPDAGDSIEILISCADDALYKSKAAGRNQVTFYQATCA